MSKCQTKDCNNSANYLIGRGKLRVCIKCFDTLSDSYKSDLQYQGLIKVLTDEEKRNIL